ncbi:TPA: hypothetical protein ANIA_11539 [Aspergillus nidulans FGSC A4]|uniref:Uncharacterized protein n=1 Tax=Emericella nidulans (strain FGSC A4 / ATCC 38163 / CBS 112.46 / NRRL 194 / M139) TaxID=227321 RepID=C8VB92_EMENI|nr:TPA: hypothetical protein ANIA_11539 [Aspergillus nidulans FGSC A4]
MTKLCPETVADPDGGQE